MSRILYGQAIGGDVAFGSARHYSTRLDINKHHIATESIQDEQRRFQNARLAAIDKLEQIESRLSQRLASEVTEFIHVHRLMLADPQLSDQVNRLIEARQINTEWALAEHGDELATVFSQMEDDYLSARMDDVRQVIKQILHQLHPEPIDASTTTDGSLDGADTLIVIADDLSPADLSLLHQQGIAGLITEHGTPLSHTAILARNFNIPTVQGIAQARQLIHADESLILDAERGIVLVEPGPALTRHYRQRKQRSDDPELTRLSRQPACSSDGQAICIEANIDLPQDIEHLDQQTVDGIGLYRTEYLFLNRRELPGEEEQYHAYQRLIEAMEGRPVTIRTLDLGADKHPGDASAPIGSNPALGLRAIRLCLQNDRLFRPQIRALLRAACHGSLRVLIPMLSTSTEIFQIRALFDQALDELQREGVPCSSDYQLGGMIEVPAAALSTRTFARHLDFLSIGTNDLIQYTLAIDRIDHQVNYLYDPLHPSVLRLLALIIAESAMEDTPLTMCGEMAGDHHYTRLLLGMGLRQFSMQSAKVGPIKRIIHETDVRQLADPVRRILNATNPARLKLLVEELNAL